MDAHDWDSLLVQEARRLGVDLEPLHIAVPRPQLREGVDFPMRPVKQRTPVVIIPEVETPRALPALPELSKGTRPEFEQVARLRKLPDDSGPALASDLGCLRFCTAYDEPAWACLDVENPCNVQLRRMDGKLWFGKTKVMGVTGNWAAWPVGLACAHRFPKMTVWLVEGTGDFIAAWHLAAAGAEQFIPVAMFGASQAIHAGALPLFCGRRVRIVQQNDRAGAEAAARWGEQLRGIGAVVEVWVVPGEGRDLNDFLSDGK